MRSSLLFLSLILGCQLSAQCPFTPMVGPTGIILCPFTTDTLTTEEYDSYQWYKDGQPIPGATARTLPVSFQADAGFRFQVAATLDGCTAFSDSVLVDGWAFPIMQLTSGGDAPLSIDNGGLLRYCQGDTGTLTLNFPYTANIMWLRDGLPLPGEEGTTLTVTTSGSYTAHAAPGQCPQLVFAMDASVPYQFEQPVPPTLVHIGSTLCAQPFNAGYTWFRDGVPVEVGTCHEPQEPGSYTAQLLAPGQCTAPSAPYVHLATGLAPSGGAQGSTVRVLGDGRIRVERPAHDAMVTHWRILDALGRSLQAGTFPASGPLELTLTTTVPALLLFQPLNGAEPSAPATRFVPLL